MAAKLVLPPLDTLVDKLDDALWAEHEKRKEEIERVLEATKHDLPIRYDKLPRERRVIINRVKHNNSLHKKKKQLKKEIEEFKLQLTQKSML